MESQIVSESTAATARGNGDDRYYAEMLASIQTRFAAHIANGEQLFTTNAAGLWDAYLGAFPAETRQYHNCTACRHFIERFGGLVVISEGGAIESAIWNTDDALDDEAAAIGHLVKMVRRAQVTGVFLSKETIWGQPETGPWRHLCVSIPPERAFRHSLLTAGQAMAEKAQDFQNVHRAIGEFKAEHVNQALALLKSDALYRSEKVLGQAQWLAELHDAIQQSKRNRDTIIWRAVASAPAGFCHPRSSMIGTLLEDIAAGVSFEVASRKFAEKMHPLQYQRPQAAPSQGNIQQAEKLVEKLGIARSLERRFARVEELQTLWTPAPVATPAQHGGVFGHLKPKGVEPEPRMTAPTQVITWEKFARTVLPEAVAITAYMPSAGHFAAILTAVHDDAPPILQWDSVERRNPFSWYQYHRGSTPQSWGLVAHSYTPVTAITLRPAMWNGGFEHQGKAALLILEGARDSRSDQGNAIFPETLKSEMHGVRATIEAFSKIATIHGAAEASACGLIVPSPMTTVRVTDKRGTTTAYNVDRWD